MTAFDPKRLVDSGTLAPIERVLLEVGEARGPSDAQCEAVWASLSEQLGPAHAEGVSPQARGTGLGAVGKAALAAMAAAAAAFGAATLPSGATANMRGTMAAAGVAASIASLRLAPVDRELPSAPLEPPVAPVLPALDGASRRETSTEPRHPIDGQGHVRSRVAMERAVPLAARPPQNPADDALHAESALILRAHQALRAGSCEAALEGLNEARIRFPMGALIEEREALGVRALACAGQTAEAGERARAFLHDHPTSPYVATVRRFAP
jgi:hypothetical protein